MSDRNIPSKTVTQFGWLLEMTDFSKRPIYFSPGWNGLEWHWITIDPNIAVRFSRKEDAERLMTLFPRLDIAILSEEKWHAVEHGFMGSAVETTGDAPPQPRDAEEFEALVRDANRYRFLRNGEDEMSTAEEERFAEMWTGISRKGIWRERMDSVVDAAMQEMSNAVKSVCEPALTISKAPQS